MNPIRRTQGFTLIELLTALLILSLLALMSYRGLGAVLDARDRVTRETDKWQRVTSFFERFERDVRLAAPRPARTASGMSPAWLGRPGVTPGSRLEFSRFASGEGVDTPRRLAYLLNEQQQVELWVWPGLDVAPDASPARYPVLKGVKALQLAYFSARLGWVDAWPAPGVDTPMPRAVLVRVVLGSGEEVERIFALQ